MNGAAVKKELGANPSLTFQSCNTRVNQDFATQGDGMRNSAPLLTDLVNEGIRLLVYAGNAGTLLAAPRLLECADRVLDAMCNFMGNERWVSKFDNVFHEEFASSGAVPWVIKGSGRVAGTVRTAGGNGFTAGNVTFLTVHESG
jgi:cathepsin A (carboxypeptidase C)